jgi:hypothetical protein
VFARSLKAAIDGIRSLILHGRPTAYKDDQSVQRTPDLRSVATDQRNARDLNELLTRNGIVS